METKTTRGKVVAAWAAALLSIGIIVAVVIDSSRPRTENPASITEASGDGASDSGVAHQQPQDAGPSAGRLLERARARLERGDLDAARDLLGKMSRMKRPMDGGVALLREEIEAAQRKRRAALIDTLRRNPRNRVVEAGSVKLRVRRLRTRDRWVFDRYDIQYHYRTADKDAKYVVVDLDIESYSKSPQLPALDIYELQSNGSLSHVDRMEIRYYRWRDYGAYLGNYHDDLNDFSKRDVIRFTAGAQVRDEMLDRPLVVVASRTGCMQRERERFAQPPLSWHPGTSCPDTYGIDAEGFEEHFVVLRVLNRRRLPSLEAGGERARTGL